MSAVIVGAGRGFGLEAAKGLGLLGHRVYLADISQENLSAGQTVLDEAGVECVTKLLDAQDERAVTAFANDIMADKATVDAVVSMVGGSLGTSRWLSGVDVHQIEDVVRFCVAPAWNVGRAFHDSLIKSGGSFVLVSSSAARYGDRLGWSLPYAFGKGAILGLTRFISCAPEWQGVRVSAMCPGDVATERTGEIHASGIMSAEEVTIVHERRNMLRRMGSPAEVGQAIVQLATNTFISGAILDVNGGEFPTPA